MRSLYSTCMFVFPPAAARQWLNKFACHLILRNILKRENALQFWLKLNKISDHYTNSSVGIATRYGLGGPGIESRWGARFSASVQTGPGAHTASCTMGTGSSPGLKRPVRGVDHPPSSRAEVEGRVGLYLYSPSGPSWLVPGWTLPLPLPYTSPMDVAARIASVTLLMFNKSNKCFECILYGRIKQHSVPCIFSCVF